MSLMHQRLVLGSSLVTLFFSGTAPAHADDRPVIRVGVQQVVNSGALTPLREQSNVGARIFPMIYAPLIELDQQGDLSQRPGLAESWKRIDDRTVQIKLRKGATFHNGDQVTAEDIVFSFGPQRMFGDTRPRRNDEASKTMQSDETKPLFTTTTGETGPALPPEVPAVARRLWPALDRVEIVDPYTVKFVWMRSIRYWSR